jgi:hypothetical protein
VVLLSLVLLPLEAFHLVVLPLLYFCHRLEHQLQPLREGLMPELVMLRRIKDSRNRKVRSKEIGGKKVVWVMYLGGTG